MILLNLFFFLLNFITINSNSTKILLEKNKVYVFVKPNFSFARSSYSEIYTDKENEYISFLDNPNFNIHTYSLKTFKIVNSKYLKKDSAINKSLRVLTVSEPNDTFTFSMKVSAFLRYSPDSLFILPQGGNDMYLLDSNMMVTNEWVIQTDGFTSPTIDIYAGQGDKFYFSNNSLYISGYGYAIPSVWHTSNPVINYDIKNREIISRFGTYPSTYKPNKWWFTVGSEVYKTMNDDKDILISYPTSHEIQLYHNNKLIQKKEVVSSYLKNYKFPYFNDSKRDDLAYKIEYSNTLGRYTLVIYDSYRNVYYRIVQLPQQYENKNGSKNLDQDREWSIQIIDKDLTLIGEQKFPKKMFNNADILVCKDGLLISNNNFNKQKLNQII